MRLSFPTPISIPPDDLVNLYEELGKELVETLQQRGIFKTAPPVVRQPPAATVFSKWFRRGAEFINSVALPHESTVQQVQLTLDGWLRLYSQLDTFADILLSLVNQDETESPITHSQLLDQYGPYIVSFMENWYSQLVSHTDSTNPTSGQAQQLACQYNSELVYRLSYIQFFRYETVIRLIRQAFDIPYTDSKEENPHTLVEMMEAPAGDTATGQGNRQDSEYSLEDTELEGILDVYLSFYTGEPEQTSSLNDNDNAGKGQFWAQLQTVSGSMKKQNTDPVEPNFLKENEWSTGSESQDLPPKLPVRSIDDEVNQLRNFFVQKSCVQTMAQLCAENPLNLESIGVGSLTYQYNTLLRNHPTIFTKTSIPNLHLWGLWEWQSQWESYASYRDLLDWMKGLPKNRFYNATELLHLRWEAGLLPALIGLEKDDSAVVSSKKAFRNMLAEAFSAGKLQRKIIQGVYGYHLKQTAITRKKPDKHFSPDQLKTLLMPA